VAKMPHVNGEIQLLHQALVLLSFTAQPEQTDHNSTTLGQRTKAQPEPPPEQEHKAVT